MHASRVLPQYNIYIYSQSTPQVNFTHLLASFVYVYYTKTSLVHVKGHYFRVKSLGQKKKMPQSGHVTGALYMGLAKEYASICK